ncbi:MAG TPA: 3-deoxy-D-manno-octulosonic acid transferase [Geobacteraceae bacterium]|nr:3-deoxy-D-manno-octulosonic acid transferase [Geobacteraceae bacterium]
MFIYFIYDLLLLLAAPIITVYYLVKSLKRGRPTALKSRFGILSADELGKIAGSETIWVHAVSVGETNAVKSLLKALKQTYPQKKVILSNVTETGRSVSLKIAEADLCIYFPFDFSFAVRKVMDAVKPAAVIIVETEIWPNFLREARRCSIPVILVNGRISDRSYKKYMRLEWVFRRVLANISSFCMQTDEDARRIVAMGAMPSSVHVTKNLKYDMPVVRLSREKLDLLRKTYRIPASASVFTGGSTHQGEEELVINTYKNLLRNNGNIFLVIAPRHPERAERVAEILRKEDIPFKMRSALESQDSALRCGQALLLDTVGELMSLYALSDLVFVGGSMVPVGGHNLLEPASMGVPVLFGPFMNNFREIASLIVRSDAGVQVENEAQMVSSACSLMGDNEKRRDMGINGARILEKNSGSTERHMEIISGYLTGQDAR